MPLSAFAQEAEAVPAISGADTSWFLISTALVLLMTSGLAFFYGALVRSKNALNTMMMSFVAQGAAGYGPLPGIPLPLGRGVSGWVTSQCPS